MALTKVTYSMIAGQYVNVLDYGADPTGVADSYQAIQDAIDASAGRWVYVPAGTYVVSSTLTYTPASYSPAFGPALKIVGDGPLKTIFDNQADGPLIDMTTASTALAFFGALGAVLDGFTIKRTISTTGGVGIKMTTAYNPTIQNVHIIGMSSHGIQIPCVLGDNDGSNMVRLDHVRIENCAGWGIKADGASGFNEISFIYMQHVFVQGCGTVSAALEPPSGGMIWKGQILTMQQCAFTINENCGLFIPGAAGLANTVDIQDTAFENNKSRGVFCKGILGFKARNVQFYNNDAYSATVGCEFDGGTYTVQQVDIDGVVVRATSGNNPYTAFKLSGASTDFDTCRVRNVIWNNFDYAGQTRFDGWQFDQVQNCGTLTVLSASEVVLRPNPQSPFGKTVPLRLAGPRNQTGVGVASTSGEWIAHQISNSGITLSLTGLAATTRFYVYLYDNAGLPALAASTTSWAIGAYGYPVKSDNATYFYVGSFETGASTGTAKTTAGGWLNPQLVPTTQVGVVGYLWADATGALRIKTTALPSSDTDGTVVGTQT